MPMATEPEVSSPRAPTTTGGGPAPVDDPRGPGRWDPVRVACHLAAELPFVLLCIRSMTTGWRATSDDAVIAWRAWNVLSAHPTLLGAPTHTAGLGHQAFAPGPVLSWFLVVPVHLDPAQGALWGSTIIAVVAAGLAVEAGWAVARRWGALGASLAVLVVATTQTAVAMNPVWTPWLGALWMVTASSCAWATASGRFRWWPACVVAASIAAQAHLVFALAAVAVCLGSPLLGWSVLRRPVAGARGGPTGPGPGYQGTVRRPLIAGVGIGALLWLPTALDQMAGTPGNLTLLWRSSRQAGGHIGYARALQGLGAAIWPRPSWTHRLPLPTSGQQEFLAILATAFHGPPWHGVATLVALAALGCWCTWTRRHVLAGLTWVAFLGGLAAVVTIAQTPATDAFELVYLSVLYWSVGTVAVGALVAGLVEIVRAATATRLTRANAGRIRGAALTLAVVGVVALAIGVTVVDGRSLPNAVAVQGGPPVGVVSDRSAAAVAAVAPRRPFVLLLDGTASPERAAAAYPAIAYDLVTRGLAVRLPPASAVGVDAARTATGREPTVTVDISTFHPSVRVQPPGTRR